MSTLAGLKVLNGKLRKRNASSVRVEVKLEEKEDGRFYLPLVIFGKECLRLLDSGATKSILGGHKPEDLHSRSVIGEKEWER